MIHSTAIISDSAVVAEDVEIGAYTVVGDGVEIDTGTVIDSHVVINGPAKIGKDNHIYQFTSIGDDPQDLKYANEPTCLTIGARNTFREFCTVSRGTIQDASNTIIGDDNLFMAYVHIAHDCIIGNKTILANNTTLAGHVHLADQVICSGFSGVHQFCYVGAHAFLGNYAAVLKNVPAYITVSGRPAIPRGINSEGLKRRDFTTDQIRNIKNAYRLVYRKGLKLEEAKLQIKALCADQPELNLFLESLRSSERGIVR
jgi:UDP-N-acetylglucosamine acyltransferase